MDYNALNVYTDGSSYSAPRIGGVGVRFVFPEHLEQEEEILDLDLQGYKGGSNNQMELKACILALEKISETIDFSTIKRVVIHTDSMYVVENFNNAKSVWSQNGWTKSGGAPVANAEIWKELIKVSRKVKAYLDIVWVKGHSTSLHNKAADKLAKKSTKKMLKNPLSTVVLRKNNSDQKTIEGSVEMKGQKIEIKIITTEYLSIQKRYKNRYIVLSKGSKFFGSVDFIYSKIAMRAGHKYIVTVNKDCEFPQVVRIIKDITKEERGGSV